MYYLKYYVWNVFISFIILVPVYYVLNILVHIKRAALLEDYELQNAIIQQGNINYLYRKEHNIKGLLDPIEII